ncbi:hypothetical protein H9Q69_003397 [Fusarium xylarioides]|uniref:Uncharacterized protein n=1 Tax=Fusarium xylarioides TaxID=221167 RepID=A0A9P7IHY7_9HYPO|nr:hypothetical protein H9Q70_001786 [Fusarium xylarioides]KAG5770039.1 hypothetical protein H9Q72_002947 [Fusarium xylarioides]KAG5783848.1 hypothetical protein H9Q73_002496 [Fusarium xylarioides]KAG5797537.1 hypothetical protein H9Q69_003397 [Fusarium xylarioides]KAG5803190.1 hypothetical protein H9Q71_012231 [Fusarium xylarioides]
MKFTIIAALAVLSGVHAAESASTTITCSSCPSAVTTPDIVTRSALPTTSCTEKPLTVVSLTKGGSGAAAPTGSGAASTPTAQVPVSGASIKKGSVGGMAAAAAMVAVYML